jgi:hypothetical protein
MTIPAETTPAETKTKKSRTKNPVPVVEDLLPVDADVVAASFRAVKIRTDFHKSLDALAIGDAVQAKGLIARIAVAVNSFEKKTAETGVIKYFKLVPNVKKPGWIIIQRAKLAADDAPEPDHRGEQSEEDTAQNPSDVESSVESPE